VEFGQLDLDDARLIRRARILMESMAATPTASVPKASPAQLRRAARHAHPPDLRQTMLDCHVGADLVEGMPAAWLLIFITKWSV
jgi:hypothetical protein